LGSDTEMVLVNHNDTVPDTELVDLALACSTRSFVFCSIHVLQKIPVGQVLLLRLLRHL
jgi:hypothetical protein